MQVQRLILGSDNDIRRPRLVAGEEGGDVGSKRLKGISRFRIVIFKQQIPNAIVQSII